MKTFLFFILSTMLLSSSSTTESIHQFVVTDIEGNKFDFSLLKGKKLWL